MLIVLYSLLFVRAGGFTLSQPIEDKTVFAGKAMKMTCSRTSTATLLWIRVVGGELPEILGKSSALDSAVPRITTILESGTFVLRIKPANISDTGLYFCMAMKKKIRFLKRVNLKVKDNFSNPTEDFVTHQSSVPENTTSPGDRSVCCYSSRPNRPQPTFSFACGDEEYEKDQGFLTWRCTFNNISSSGNYLCSVGKCGKIFAGNGSEPDTEASPYNMLGFQKDTVLLSILSVALTISLILTAFLTCSIIKLRNKLCGRWTGEESGSHSQQVSAKSGFASVINSHSDETAAVPLQRTAVNVSVDHHAQETDEDSLVYSAATFRKLCSADRRDPKTEEDECIYTDVRDIGLN